MSFSVKKSFRREVIFINTDIYLYVCLKSSSTYPDSNLGVIFFWLDKSLIISVNGSKTAICRFEVHNFGRITIFNNESFNSPENSNLRNTFLYYEL